MANGWLLSLFHALFQSTNKCGAFVIDDDSESLLPQCFRLDWSQWHQHTDKRWKGQSCRMRKKAHAQWTFQLFPRRSPE